MPTPKKNQKTDMKKRQNLKASSKISIHKHLHHLMAIGLITGFALIAYSNTFSIPFHFDDKPNILDNPNIQIKVLTWDHLERLIQNTYKETIRIFSYLTFAFNYYLGEFNVFGYHLVNLLIHIASGIFLYWFLILTINLPSLKEKYGTLSYKLSLFTSLIFITHPVQTQSVTYIVQRMASMAGMFYILTMILYVKGRLSQSKRRWGYFVAAGLTYLLGIFSKENVAILPIFVLIYEFYFFQNLTLNSKRKKTFISVAISVGLIASLGLALWGERYYEVIIEGYKIRDFTLVERVLTQFRVVLYYLTLLAFPHPSRLNLDYDFPLSRTFLDPPTTLVSIVIVSGLISYSIFIAKKRPVLSYCILWYFGNLAIESSIFPLEMVFEHRLYIPAISLFILFSQMVIKVAEKIKSFWRDKNIVRLGEGLNSKKMQLIDRIKFQFLELVIFLVIIILFSLGTYIRNNVWKSEIDLWKDSAQKSPKKPRVYVNLGIAYANAGEYYKALKEVEKSIQINPNYAPAYYSYGLIIHKLGELDKAIYFIKKALEIDPTLYKAFYSLGAIYFEKGLYGESVEAYKKFLEIFPYFPEIHHHLALAYAAQKKFDKAVKEFEWELKINPYHTLVHLNLGQIYWYEFQNREKALKHLKVALALDPFLPNRRGIQSLVQQLEKLP